MQTLFGVKLIIRQGLNALAVEAPYLSFLFTGVSGDILAFFGEKALMFLVEKTALKASEILFTLETEAEKKAYNEAVNQVAEKIKSKAILTDKQKQELEDAVIDATRDFINLRRVRLTSKNP